MDGTVLAPSISPVVLLPHDRIAREPLNTWAARLRASLAGRLRATRVTRTLAERVGGIANNAALIAAHAGRPGDARELCRAQMRWQLRMARRSGDAALAELAIQPWVNEGRLEAIAGDWEAALARFAPLQGYETARVMRLGTACLPAASWAEVTPAPGLYATESLKALLLNRRWDETLAFCARPDGASAVAPLFAAEARVVALTRLGRFPAAAGEARRALAGAAGWERAVFLLRLAEVDACAGEVPRAAARLSRLTATMRVLSPGVKGQVRALYVTSRLASALHEAGSREEACALALDVLEGGRAAGDQVFQIEMLRLLAAAGNPERRADWDDEMAALESSTLYARYRRAPGDESALDSLFEALRALFAS